MTDKEFEYLFRGQKLWDRGYGHVTTVVSWSRKSKILMVRMGPNLTPMPRYYFFLNRLDRESLNRWLR